MASTEIEYKDGQAEKKGMGSKFSSFGKSIWDGEKKEFIGRTGSSWAKIGLFYLVYYICLSGFFAISLIIFFQTVSDDVPSQTGYNSLIKSNPGMAFRPMPDIETTLIKFKQGDPATYQKYTDNIRAFLEKYRITNENQMDCAPGEQPEEGKVCKFDIDTMLGTDCSEASHYGFYEGQPCVLLKINRVYGWEPEPYDNNTLPNELQPYSDKYSSDGIFVTCEGENHGDVDNLGEIELFPKAGFLNNYFPYKNIPGYQSPLVFVRLRQLQWGVITQVWCKAWARNLKHHKNDKAGSTHFEVLMD